MDGFEIGKFVVISVHADAEEQAGVSPVDDFIVPELVSGLVPMSERSQGGIPRQSSIDTSGPGARLSGGLPHEAGPTAGGLVSLIAGMPPDNRSSPSPRRRMGHTIWTTWSCPGDSANGYQRRTGARGMTLTCTRMNLIMQKDAEATSMPSFSAPWSSPKRRGRVNAADNPGSLDQSWLMPGSP